MSLHNDHNHAKRLKTMVTVIRCVNVQKRYRKRPVDEDKSLLPYYRTIIPIGPYSPLDHMGPYGPNSPSDHISHRTIFPLDHIPYWTIFPIWLYSPWDYILHYTIFPKWTVLDCIPTWPYFPFNYIPHWPYSQFDHIPNLAIFPIRPSSSLNYIPWFWNRK